MKNEIITAIGIVIVAAVLVTGLSSYVSGQADLTGGNMTGGNMTGGNMSQALPSADDTSSDGGEDGDEDGGDGGDGGEDNEGQDDEEGEGSN